MSRDDEIDTSFGINFIDGKSYIANTPIKIEHDDIIIYDEVYEGTPGLWSLITEKTKGNLEGKYTDNDLATYEDILRQTNVLYKDFNPSSSYPRSSGSWKWRSILAPIWTKLQDEKTGNGLIIKNSGHVWKIRRHSGKGFRKLLDGTYYKKGHMIYKL